MSFRFKITNVTIENFRGIKKLDVNLSKNTIIVGNNNVGKSTFVDALTLFQNTRNWRLQDINVELIERLLTEDEDKILSCLNDFKICVEMTFKWKDLPSELYDLISTLDGEGDTSVRSMKMLTPENVKLLKEEITTQGKHFNVDRILGYFTRKDEIKVNDTWELLPETKRKLMFPNEDLVSNDGTQKIIHVQASRKVENGRASNDKLASVLFKDKIDEAVDAQEFQSVFNTSIETITDHFDQQIGNVQGMMKKFAFPNNTIEDLYVRPELDVWLNPQKRNVRLVQKKTLNDDEMCLELPFVAQGLGYQNVFNILGKIQNDLDTLKKHTYRNHKNKSVLLVIEEPEAFTHPQLQRVFVKQVVDYVEEIAEKSNVDIQTILISHSAEVAVAAIEKDSKFELIKFQENEVGNVDALQWSEFEAKNGNTRFSRLLLNYNAEMLFAEKLILFEGDSERIMITALMRRLDRDVHTDLMEQQIALIPVGKSIKSMMSGFKDMGFKKVIFFTDLDFGSKKDDSNRYSKEFEYDSATNSTNEIIKTYFIGENDFKSTFPIDSGKTSVCSKISEELRIYTQGPSSNDFYPMTLEPAIINEDNNFDLLVENEVNGIEKNTNVLDKISKVDFALSVAEVALEENDFKIPGYLKDGLTWLAQ